MMTRAAKVAAPGPAMDPADERDMRTHLALLRHDRLGVMELRVFDPRPQVAYADNENDTGYGDQNCLTNCPIPQPQ